MKEVIKSWSEYTRKRPIAPLLLSLLWLCAIAWVAFVWNLGNIGLVDETEPLFAEAARQMTVRGDWITPYFNGNTRFDKPPLIYWLMALAYRAIGVNEWAVRLPSALCAIALTCLGFYTLSKSEGRRKKEEGRRKKEEGRGNEEEGMRKKEEEKFPPSPIPPLSPSPTLPIFLSTPWIGAALIALNPQTIAWGRTGVSDMLLVSCMCSALLVFFLGYTLEEQRSQTEFSTASTDRFPNKWYLTFYVLIALAILAKGPVGIVIPALIIGCFVLYLGNFRQLWREMRPVSGILIILAIALPWYILVTIANGQTYIDSFFGYHNFQRFTEVVNKHSAPWYFYFFVVLLGFAPWSIYLPVAIARTRFWQRSYWRRQPRSAQLSLFALFWFGCIFGFFTIAVTKLPSYVLPLLPAAAILVTLLWADIIAGKEDEGRVQLNKKPNSLPRSLLVTFIVNIVFLLVLAGAIFYCYHWLGDDPAMPNFPQALQQSGLLIVGGAIWIIAAGAIAILLWKRQQRWILVANFIGLVAFIIFGLTPAYNLVDINRQLPLRQLAQVAVQQKLPGEEFMMIGFAKPSVVFYSHLPVTYYRLPKGAIDYIEESHHNQTSSSILVLGYPDKFVKFGLLPNEYQLLDSRGAYQLARVPRQAFL